jgi:uncharacterized protein DUF1549/uncharacterized protein DUF1553/cytochrome c
MRFKGVLAGTLAAAWCGVAALAAAAPKPEARPAAPKAPAPMPVPADPKVSPEAAEFFETHVRPVLAEQCYNCHGPKLQQAGLRVDSLAAMLRGTDAGKPALVPGDPDKSSLIQAIRWEHKVKMPPQGKLPDKAIEALTQWVKMGAPWPGGGAQATVSPEQQAKKHWAFQPVRKPAVPAVKNKAWVKTPIDAFVLAKLEKKGMAPSPPADRRTLIRRASFDLIGLPPTAEEVEEFVNDKSPDAWEKVIDRLLASPHYGERWGRYWLDVARYADTKGYVFQEERRYPFAYTYRDWVIRAFNEDLPYDQFLIRQLAADHLQLGEDKRSLAAMGFLTLGRRFLNNQADIIDDRLDVVFRGTQALTVGCARCHDHKFDPIPIKDYYSLYGVFASSTEPQDLPLIAVPAQTEAYQAYERELKKLEAEMDSFRTKKHGEKLAELRARAADYLLAAHEAGRPNADVNGIARSRDLSQLALRRWMSFLAETRKAHHPVMAAWHAFAAVPDNEFAAKGSSLAAKLAANNDPQNRLNPLVAQAFAGQAPASLKEVAQRYGQVLASVNKPDVLPDAGQEEVRQVLYGQNSPLNLGLDQVDQLFNRADRNQAQAIKQKVDRFKATNPAAPARAMVMVDAPNPNNPRVFLRGNPNNPGPEVPRQFLAVLSGPSRKPFEKGSGRLEMAQAIAGKDNPLTARVMVNRVWIGHFGAGLVRTPSDFGLRSDPPTHPELLDWLASYFVAGNEEMGKRGNEKTDISSLPHSPISSPKPWSVKKLHRQIMLSATYQQSSDVNLNYARLDPENKLLSRMNRRRLDFEAMRDSLLAASGQLDDEMGGPAVDLLKAPYSGRRTVYGFIDRQNLPGLFRIFDFASPDTHSPQRYNTTVPQQALFMLNSPFVVEQARKLASRQEVTSQTRAADRVRQLYRLAYGRDPDPEEATLALRFLKGAQALDTEEEAKEPQVWQYGYGEVDETAGRLKSFEKLPYFNNYNWQGGAQLPDPKTGWVFVSANGGHPGNDLKHASIRRWAAPRDGVVSIAGTVEHPNEEGDGVRARIISSRAGILGTWTAQHSKAATDLERVEVKAGDTLDFVVDCRTGPNHDSFTWAPVIRLVEGTAGAQSADGQTEWNARTGFSGPKVVDSKSLSPWEKYAQVLLLSNEFMFVD